MPISVEYLVVAGGGGGGSDTGGGGGGGGVLTGTASKAYATTFTVTVGDGGAGGQYPTNGVNGSNSVFDSVTATGGGKGATETFGAGSSGGSGGGGAGGPGLIAAGAGTSGQGNAGGSGGGTNPSTYGRAGGGGGAGSAGSAGGATGGNGGNGVASSITGTSITYAGGGGGGSLNSGNGGTGGTGGGGNGGGPVNVSGTNGTDELGGGGGGGSNDTGGTREKGGNGGKGVVILKFLTADSGTPTTTGSPTITTSGSYKIYKFTSSGTISFSDPGVSISATVTNIALDAKDASILIGTDVLISATTSNTNIDGKDATLIYDYAVFADVTNIAVLGYIPIVVAGGSITVPANQNTINVNGKDPSLIIGITQSASSTDISLTGGEVDVLYPTLVLNLDPIHYYKFDSDASPTVITDLGSNPVNLTWALGEVIDYYSGIPGDPFSESASFNVSADNPAGSDILTFSPNIFSNETDYTVEFWVKTLDSYVAIICADKNNQTISGKTYRNNAVIGINDGYLAFWIHRETGASDVIKSTNKLNNNIWNHVVLTKKTLGSSIQYKSYVNAQETDVLISLGDFMPWIIDAPRPSLINYLNDGNTKQTGHTYNVYLDEFAIYNSALSQADISGHYNSGHGLGSNISITSEVTNVAIDAKDAATGTVINTTVTNIKVTNKGTIIRADFYAGGPTNKRITVGATVSELNTAGKDATLTSGQSVSIYTENENVNVNQTNTAVITREALFKFVSSQDTSLSAEDAVSITELEYGGLLYNQIKKLLFSIANTSTSPSTFNISIESNESLVIDAVQLSVDNITYANSITIENVRPNSITNPIYVKFDVNILDVLGPGTFLINVEQI
jgi:hypothetical protein